MADHPDAPAESHADAQGAHGAAHDDHGHGGEALGPPDVTTWALALLGLVLGLAVVYAFVAAAS